MIIGQWTTIYFDNLPIESMYFYIKNSNYVNISTSKQIFFPRLFFKGGGINKTDIFLYSSRLFLYSCTALSSPWMSPLCLFLGASCPSPRDLSRLILASSLNLLFSVFKFYKKVTLLLILCTNCIFITHILYRIIWTKKCDIFLLWK